IRDRNVTGVQTCALPISLCPAMALSAMSHSTEIMEATTRPFGIRKAHDRMAAAMRARGRVLVAFSGGVDSGLVARVAHDALGDKIGRASCRERVERGEGA